ncbi:hypothetical protein P9148_09560 [Bacillus siamensis]|nr:hypothetical protein [Bacillus siamensis]MEC3655351.1 hypothetical protein [Bacillus siamensis]
MNIKEAARQTGLTKANKKTLRPISLAFLSSASVLRINAVHDISDELLFA